MLHVYICVGSVCIIKGSNDIIKIFVRLIKENGLSDTVELKASFCVGNCKKGVSVKVEEEFIDGINSSNAEDKFNKYILERLKNGHNPV